MKKNKAAQDMARKRAESLTPERRKGIAAGAAKARWEKKAAATAPEKCAPYCTKLHEHTR